MKRNVKRAGLQIAALALLFTFPASAQEPVPSTTPEHDHSKMATDPAGMAGMNHGGMNGGELNDAGKYLMTMNSGTSVAPASWPMPMLMPKLGSWKTMLMGQAFLVDTQQSQPRGGDKLYSATWLMASATHSLGSGGLMLQAMVSLDPATITSQRYPLLFQTGETAHGIPLADAQHPHDFLMGIGVQYARPAGEHTMLQLYYAPVGNPALGPVAFPHRASALELPQATISHHLQDSTHIANNVATVAVRYRWLRLEASGFYGGEPDEHRWDVDWGPMDSFSGRISVFPSSNWMAQFSAGRLTHPEMDHPGDVVRTTASLHYTRPTGGGNAWSTSLIWGRNHEQVGNQNLNSYLVETLYPATSKDFLTGRFEIVDKNELFANDHEVEERFAERYGSSFRIQAYTGGYTRDIDLLPDLETGMGANASFYVVPSALHPYYGEHPWGVSMFLRVRLKKNR